MSRVVQEVESEDALIATLRSGRAARRRRVAIIVAALAVLLAGIVLARLTVLRPLISISDLIAVLSGRYVEGAGFVVWESSLPRATLGLIAGAALGASGGAMQSLLANPLASPDILGITSGASAAAVTALVLGGWNGPALAAAAFAGALAVVALMIAVGGRGTAAPTRMILVGVGMGMVFGALIHGILQRANIWQAREAMVWLVGSLARATWTDIGWVGLIVAITLPALVITGEQLRVLSLGPDVAQSLGVRVRRQRGIIVALVVVLVASVTSVCGPIAFVPLLAGPIARRLHGGRTNLVTAALVGACLVIASDHLASQAIANTALPAGVVTGLLGGPALLWFVVRSTKVQGVA